MSGKKGDFAIAMKSVVTIILWVLLLIILLAVFGVLLKKGLQ